MTAILIPVIIVAVIGLIVGLGLAFASKFMSVPVDETQQKVRECLPGANCGACGYSGCDGYAEAIANGEAEPDKCAPGGEATAAALSEVLGVEISAQSNVAFVKCTANREISLTKYSYNGMMSCAAAALVQGGPLDCANGCIGFGDCVKACQFGAITSDGGAPVVCEDLCGGCGQCAAACPKSLIEIIPKGSPAKVRCSNTSKGATVVKTCKASCIACGMCERVCESGAIKVVNNLAVIDYSLCTGCGKCKEACKRGCIV